MAKKSATKTAKPKSKTKSTSNSKSIQHLAEMIAGIQFAMLTTAGARGVMHSRPMQTMNHEPESFDGTLWFFTDVDSPKVREVKSNPRVNLAYADADSNRYVSISGRASVVTDRNKVHKMWTPAMKAWFPKGKIDPKIALLEVKADDAEYWDAPASRMVRLAYYLKAIVTGTRATDMADNKKLRVGAMKKKAKKVSRR